MVSILILVSGKSQNMKKGALERYLLLGIPPGDFLTTVLKGDVHAILRADEDNRSDFHDIVAFLYNEAPGGS